MEEIKNIHKGHRQRLKDKVRKAGLSALSQHEVMELLLTYTIPQKDTNELAHKLILSSGGFASVFDSGYTQLKNQKGIGDETALFLSILPKVFELYKQDKNKVNQMVLRSPENCVSYFRKSFEVGKRENLYIVCLNSQNKVDSVIDLQGESDSKINIDSKNLISKLTSKSISAIVMYHTHPKGDPTPSVEDLDTTLSVMYICAMLDIMFYDHIIFTETKHLSLGSENYLDALYEKVYQTWPKFNSKCSQFFKRMNFKNEDNK